MKGMNRFMKNVNIVDQIIDELVSIGSGNVDIMKFNKKWTFKIVNAKEHSSILDSSSDSANDMVGRIFKMQSETVKEALVAINDQALTEEEKRLLVDSVNPYIIQTIYRLYDAERAKKEKEIEELK